MKVIITYMSLTGNTKKIAEAIFQEIQEEKEIKELEKLENLEGYDLAFVGFPIIEYSSPEEVKSFLAQHGVGKKIALFVTHAAPEYSEDLPPWLEKCQEAAAGANVLGLFNCQGELAQFVVDELLKSADPKVRGWGEASSSTKGQPDAARVERARLFAKEMMEMRSRSI